MPHLRSTAEQTAQSTAEHAIAPDLPHENKEHSIVSAEHCSESILYGIHSPELIRQETLSDLLEATAKRYPEHIALIFDSKEGQKQLSYQELNQQADLQRRLCMSQQGNQQQLVGLQRPFLSEVD